jgi:hypothetical protein
MPRALCTPFFVLLRLRAGEAEIARKLVLLPE